MASIQHRQRADGTVAHRVMFRERKGGGVVSETFDTADQARYFKNLVERIGGAAAREKRAKAEGTTAPTLTRVLEDYIGSAPDITPGTASEYRRVLARSGISETIGDLPIDLIDRIDIEKWIRERSSSVSKRTKRPIAPKTIHNEHGLISTICAHAVDRGWCRGNVAKGVRLPKDLSAELEILTDAEFLKLWTAMSDHYKPLVWLLGATGLRWGEATALQWRDVGETTVTVRQAWKHDEGGSRRILGAPKTRKAYRTVETAPKVIETLGERGKPSDYVFTNARGDSIKYHTFHDSHWKPAIERAQLFPRPTIHGLRHFAASHMLSQGADIYEVSRALGHESIQTTANTYGHLVPSRTRPTAVHAARLEQLRPLQIDE